MEKIRVVEYRKDIPGLSAQGAYWAGRKYRKIYKWIRPGLELPASVKNSQDLIDVIKSYGFNNVEFGNYVTEEDRFNYLVGFYYAIYDMNKVLGLQKNMGLDRMITIGFGSRGIPKSLAHYNPNTRFININRYGKTFDIDKPETFISTGGISSFAHEYGHALDYILGGHVERNLHHFPLTLGSSTKMHWDLNEFRTPMRKLMNKLIHTYIWKDYEKRVLSDSYSAILFESGYYRRHNEIFARLFEKYIFYKLQQRQIINRALTKSKYDRHVYATDKEFKKLVTIMDELMDLMRSHITFVNSNSSATGKKAAAAQGRLF